MAEILQLSEGDVDAELKRLKEANIFLGGDQYSIQMPLKVSLLEQ